jgi:hypothetical protein
MEKLPVKRSPRLSHADTIKSVFECFRSQPLKFDASVNEHAIEFTYRLEIPQELHTTLREYACHLYPLLEGGAADLRAKILTCYIESKTHKRDHKKTSQSLVRTLKDALGRNCVKSVKDVGSGYEDQVEVQESEFASWPIKPNQPDPIHAQRCAKRFKELVGLIDEKRRKYRGSDVSVESKRNEILDSLHAAFPQHDIEKTLESFTGISAFVDENPIHVSVTEMAYAFLQKELENEGKKESRRRIEKLVKTGRRLLQGALHAPIVHKALRGHATT